MILGLTWTMNYREWSSVELGFHDGVSSMSKAPRIENYDVDQ